MLVVHVVPTISPIIDIQTMDTDLHCMEDFFLDLHIDEANMLTIETTPPATTTTTTTTMIMIHTSIESKTVEASIRTVQLIQVITQHPFGRAVAKNGGTT